MLLEIQCQVSLTQSEKSSVVSRCLSQSDSCSNMQLFAFLVICISNFGLKCSHYFVYLLLLQVIQRMNLTVMFSED